MIASRRIRRLLCACVASNAAFALIGLASVGGSDLAPAPRVASASRTTAPNVTSTTAALMPNPAPADTQAAQTNSASSGSPSPRQSSSRTTATTRPAAAADDVTGIASSAAPPTFARLAPRAGSYAAVVSGSASVNGRAQSVPSSGSVVFTPTGSDLRQSSPDTPGDVKITQRFSTEKTSLVSFQLKASDTTKVFTPASPVTFIPYSAAQGESWSWSATSSDGATRVSANARVGASKIMTVNGTQVSVFEVVTSLSISGDISGTAELTLWASNEYRVPVVQRQVINAKGSSGYGFSTRLSSDVTQTLTSLRPS